jgi:hypothetical protein
MQTGGFEFFLILKKSSNFEPGELSIETRNKLLERVHKNK